MCTLYIHCIVDICKLQLNFGGGDVKNGGAGMDRMRPVHVKHKSVSSSTTSGNLASPMTSPMHRHSRSGSLGLSNPKKPQNTKAAAQRLAQVMAHQNDSDDEDDLMLYDYTPANTSSIGLAAGRPYRPRSPMVILIRHPLLLTFSS